MTVYVCDMCVQVPGQKSWLIADTRGELLACVDRMRDRPERVGKLEMKGQGRHNERVEVSATGRSAAIIVGAVAVKANQLFAMVWRRESTGALGDPADACDWHDAKLTADRDARLAALEAEEGA